MWHKRRPQRCFWQSSALCSFPVVHRNIAVWPHLSLLWASESWGCNKKVSVTWILILCASSAFPVKVNWVKRDKRRWLNSVAESVFLSGLETESPECYHLFLLLSSPLLPQVFLSHVPAAACKDFGGVERGMGQMQQNKEQRVLHSQLRTSLLQWAVSLLPSAGWTCVRGHNSILPEPRAGNFQLPQKHSSTAVPGVFAPGIPWGYKLLLVTTAPCKAE